MRQQTLIQFFNKDISEADPAIAAAIVGELGRQQDEIELIASENIVSHAVLQAQGSVLTNKYAEGYPTLKTKRYSIVSDRIILSRGFRCADF